MENYYRKNRMFNRYLIFTIIFLIISLIFIVYGLFLMFKPKHSLISTKSKLKSEFYCDSIEKDVELNLKNAYVVNY